MIWLLVLAAAAFAFGGGSSPPPPSGTRCTEVVLDPAWVEGNKARLLEAVNGFRSDPAELATTALLRAMQTLFPDCEWTPSTTTELVIAGIRLRFDELMRRVQGVTVADAGGLRTLLGLPPSSDLPTVDPPPPPPPTPRRCASVTLDAAWVELNKPRLLVASNDFRRDPTELAMTALLRAMTTLFPDCEWTPSTTTDVIAAGIATRFDDIVRRVQGVAVADAGALPTLLGLPPEQVLEGSTGAPTACDRTKPDGDAQVCLKRLPNGQWSWTWTSPAGGEPLTGEPGKNASEATILAYLAGATRPVAYVIASPISRAGVRLETDGTIALIDAATWGTAVHKRVQSEWSQGERDPMGIVLASLQAIFPGANWFRMKPPGGLEGAATRVQSVVSGQANAPDVVDRIARAIVGAEYDVMRHVFRGRLIELKASTQGFYSYRVDGGPWIGAYQDFNDAVAAAHGGG